MARTFNTYRPVRELTMAYQRAGKVGGKAVSFMAIEGSSRESNFVKPHHIVVATDLEDIPRLLPHAIAAAQQSAAELTLVHAVWIAPGALSDPGVMAEAGIITELEHDARKALTEASAKARDQGVACSVVVRDGDAAEIVEAEVRRTGAGRVICATHGRTGLKHVVLGSVAVRLVETVSVPVYAVGPHVPLPATRIRRVLHPVSVSGSDSAAALAFELARQAGAEITLLHVVDRTNASGLDLLEAVRLAREDLRALPARHESTPEQVEVMVRTGDPAEQILHVAGEIGADLLIMGVCRHSPWWKLPAGGTAYRVIAGAATPVLIPPAFADKGAAHPGTRTAALAHEGAPQ
jgi:nucleotide-binding universal stress UspA family protein